MKIFVYKGIRYAINIEENIGEKGRACPRSFVGFGTLARNTRVEGWFMTRESTTGFRAKVFSDKPDAPRFLLFNSGRCVLRVLSFRGFRTILRSAFRKNQKKGKEIETLTLNGALTRKRFKKLYLKFKTLFKYTHFKKFCKRQARFVRPDQCVLFIVSNQRKELLLRRKL